MWRQQVSPPYVYHLKVASANLLTNLMRVSKSWEAVPSHGFDQRSCFSTMLSWRQQNSCPAAHHSVSVAAHLCHSFCHSTPALLFLLQHVSAILSVTGHQRCSFCYSTLVLFYYIILVLFFLLCTLTCSFCYITLLLFFLYQHTTVLSVTSHFCCSFCNSIPLLFLLHHTSVLSVTSHYCCSFCNSTALFFLLHHTTVVLSVTPH